MLEQFDMHRQKKKIKLDLNLTPQTVIWQKSELLSYMAKKCDSGKYLERQSKNDSKCIMVLNVKYKL